MRNRLVALVVGLMCLPALACADSEVHISSQGVFLAKQLTVMQIAGKNIFARGYWGNAFLRITVLINASTTIQKSHGDAGVLDDLKEGDVLDVSGALSSGADTVTVNATSIRNASADHAQKQVAGTIRSIDVAARSFDMKDATLGPITVVIPVSVSIEKGARVIDMADMHINDAVIGASGIFDYSTHTLTATTLELYQDKAVFAPRNFEGTLKSVSGTTLPVTAIITVSGVDYTVYLASDISILKKNKTKTMLSRFVAGDTVRVWGAIRTTNMSEIDVSVMRDMNF